MPTQYKLSYQKDSTDYSLTYRPYDKSLTYVSERHASCGASCFNLSKDSVSQLTVGGISFLNADQENEFERALKNKDAHKALELFAREGDMLCIDILVIRDFLSNYVAQQEKINKYNNSFFVTHGLCKKKSDNRCEGMEVAGDIALASFT